MVRILTVALVTLVACGDNRPLSPDATLAPRPDAEPVPALRNPVDLPDGELATRALQLLGANVPDARRSCDACHGMTRQHLAFWRSLSETSREHCLTDLEVTSAGSARRMLNCLRAIPTSEASGFQTEKLGIYALAVKLPWFDYAVRRAFSDDAPEVLDRLRQQTAMPRGIDVPDLTQGEFDIVAEWYARGLPELDAQLVETEPPAACLPNVSAAVPAHVAAMKLAGWRAVNASNLMPMHGCAPGGAPRTCLADRPLARAQPYGAGWDVGAARIRVLAEAAFSTSFWTRSSPDGRFVGHGVRTTGAAAIRDLAREAVVAVDALYDPAFFPDNSGFMLQGNSDGNTCAIGVLAGAPTELKMIEPGCASLRSVGLYQHVGRALGGGDFFAAASIFTSDDGGHAVTLRNPRAFFSERADLDLVPMVLDGGVYVARPTATVATPFEGDAALSPSSKLVMMRFAGTDGRQLGFVLRAITATPTPDGAGYDVAAPEIARYCYAGGKPGFSYDERWAVLHHYVTDTDADARDLGFTGTLDPGFAPYRTRGAANLYLLDLATGTRTRISNMAPGQYALFPHFRSDGWIYAQVRDLATPSREYTIATDAALLAE
jgi:hypothetical protein